MATPAQIQEQLRDAQQDMREEVEAAWEQLAATPVAQRGAELLDDATQLVHEVADSAEQQVERAQEAAKQAVGRAWGRPLVLALASVGLAAGVLASVLLVRRRRKGGSNDVDAPARTVDGDVTPSEAQ